MSQPKAFRHSRQRQKMLELLQGSKEHPSADWIYKKMKQSFPNISLGTVYRNLGVLNSQGHIIRLMHLGSADRFDADTYDHSHFFCENCDSVYDIDEKSADTNLLGFPGGHKVERQVTSYFGTCSKCLHKKTINNH